MIRGFSFNTSSLRESLHSATSGVLTLPSAAPSILSKCGRQASLNVTALCKRPCCTTALQSCTLSSMCCLHRTGDEDRTHAYSLWHCRGSGLAWRSIQPAAAPALGHISAAGYSPAAAPQTAVMPLSNTQHLTATCVVMFIAALGAGYLPTLVKVNFLLHHGLAFPRTFGHQATPHQTAFD